jgi:hypothetical protein
MTTSQELQSILQLCKDYELSSVKLEMGDLKLECQFRSAPSNILTKKPVLNFPDAKYNAALQSEITADELAELGFVGVAPQEKKSRKESISNG